jgi:hypothetical protein
MLRGGREGCSLACVGVVMFLVFLVFCGVWRDFRTGGGILARLGLVAWGGCLGY